MNLLAVIGVLIPLGVVGALSSVPVTVAVAILLSKRSRINGASYLIGWTAGMFLVTLASVTGLGYLPPPNDPIHGPLLATLEIVLGALLIGYGIWRWKQPRPKGDSQQHRWLRTLASAPPATALGTGIILNLRPKALLVAIAAGLAISSAELPTSQLLIATSVYTVIAVSTVAAPVAFSLLRPATTAAWLTTARSFITAHGRALTLVICILAGAFIIGNGLTRF